jgi:hypothetical protein
MTGENPRQDIMDAMDGVQSPPRASGGSMIGTAGLAVASAGTRA